MAETYKSQLTLTSKRISDNDGSASGREVIARSIVRPMKASTETARKGLSQFLFDFRTVGFDSPPRTAILVADLLVTQMLRRRPC